MIIYLVLILLVLALYFALSYYEKKAENKDGSAFNPIKELLV